MIQKRVKTDLLHSLIVAIAAILDVGSATAAEKDFADVVEEVAARQSLGLTNADVQVRRAYVYHDESRRFADLPLPQDWMFVAVDVEFRQFSTGFDLDDVDIIDAQTLENYGSDPILFGVTPEGALADINDPAVRNEFDFLRTLLIYAVPKRVTRVGLAYWGDLLTSRSVLLEQSGPQVPRRSVRSVQGVRAQPVSHSFDRVLVLLDAENWSRIATPNRWIIPCGKDFGDIDRYVELDAAFKPLAANGSRPPFVPRRLFLIEFWAPHGCNATEISDAFQRRPIDYSPVSIPAAALQALEQTEPRATAFHRLKK